MVTPLLCAAVMQSCSYLGKSDHCKPAQRCCLGAGLGCGPGKLVHHEALQSQSQRDPSSLHSTSAHEVLVSDTSHS